MLGTITSIVPGSIFLAHLELRVKARNLDVEVLVDRFKLFA